MKKDRLYAYALSAVLLVGVGAAVIECGDSTNCGNGMKEEGEDCDHGATNGAAGDTCSAVCKSVSGPPHASIQVFYNRLMVDVGDSDPETFEVVAPFDAGSLVGKRYVNEDESVEVLCTKAGDGSL